MQGARATRRAYCMLNTYVFSECFFKSPHVLIPIAIPTVTCRVKRITDFSRGNRWARGQDHSGSVDLSLRAINHAQKMFIGWRDVINALSCVRHPMSILMLVETNQHVVDKAELPINLDRVCIVAKDLEADFVRPDDLFAPINQSLHGQSHETV